MVTGQGTEKDPRLRRKVESDEILRVYLMIRSPSKDNMIAHKFVFQYMRKRNPYE
jgi:hypothetical protein